MHCQSTCLQAPETQRVGTQVIPRSTPWCGTCRTKGTSSGAWFCRGILIISIHIQIFLFKTFKMYSLALSATTYIILFYNSQLREVCVRAQFFSFFSVGNYILPVFCQLHEMFTGFPAHLFNGLPHFMHPIAAMRYDHGQPDHLFSNYGYGFVGHSWSPSPKSWCFIRSEL